MRGCVISSSFTCTLDLCGGANDGFIANPTNCSTFYLCIGERTKRTYTCQTGLQFDHISRRCTLTPRCYPGSSSVVIVTP